MTWLPERWLRRCRLPAFLFLLALLLAWTIVGAFGFLRPRPDPLLMLDLQSNHVLFQVARPGTAGLVLREGWLRRPPECLREAGDEGPVPLAAMLAPAHGTTVEYIWQPRSLLLRYSPGAGGQGPFLTVQRDGMPDCDLSEGSFVVTLPHEALAHMPPLPVVGAGHIGSVTLDIAPPSPRQPLLLPGTGIEDLPSPGFFLHGGVIRVYARTRGDDSRIFPIPDAEFQVPRNSRVDFGLAGDGQGRDAWAMLGWAVLDPGGKGLSVHAVTRAPDVRLSGMAGELAISGGALALAFNDPSNTRLFSWLAIVIFLFPTLIALCQLLHDRREGG